MLSKCHESTIMLSTLVGLKCGDFGGNLGTLFKKALGKWEKLMKLHAGIIFVLWLEHCVEQGSSSNLNSLKYEHLPLTDVPKIRINRLNSSYSINENSQ